MDPRFALRVGSLVAGVALAACGGSVDVQTSSNGLPVGGGGTAANGGGGADGEPYKEALWSDRCDACFAQPEDKVLCLMRPSGMRCQFEWTNNEALEAEIACCESGCEDAWAGLPETDAYQAFRDACLASACNVELRCGNGAGYTDEVYEQLTRCIDESPCADMGKCFDCPYDG